MTERRPLPFDARAIDEAVALMHEKPIRDSELSDVDPEQAPDGCCADCWIWFVLRGILEGLPHDVCENAIRGEGRRPLSAPDPVATLDDVIRILDNSTPYPIDLDAAVVRFMAERVLEMAEVRRRPDHGIWQPEDDAPTACPEPLTPGE